MVSKGGRDSKKSVDWSDTDVILPGKSIEKAIVSLQIPEVLNDEAIQVLFCKKFESAKRLYHFKPQNFSRRSDTSTFLQKIWIGKAIVSFQTPEFLKMKRYKYFYSKKFELTKRLYRFKIQNLLAMKRYNYFYYYFLGEWGDSHLALKGQWLENFSPFSLEIWAPHKVDQLEKKISHYCPFKHF